MALISASLVTSALNATAVPWACLIRATVSSALARLWSTHSTLAPSRAKVSAVARPLPMPSPGLWPAPTTMAMRSFRRMSFHSRNWVLHQYLFVGGLVVYFHGGQHADNGAVEGDSEHEIGHMLIAEHLLDLGEGSLGHREFARHLARALQDRACERLERRRLALGLRHHVADILVGDAELLADLDVMGEFVLRLLHPAHLKNREFTQARVELALEADVGADAAEGARHVGRIDQELVQVGVALEDVAIFGRDLIGLEIGQAGHFVRSPLTSFRFRHYDPLAARNEVSHMNEPPEHCAQRAEPESNARQALNSKTRPAFFDGLHIADHVENAAGDPDQAEHGGDRVADIDGEQPQRGQENRHPFQRVHLHAEHPLEVGIAGYRGQPDAVGPAGPHHPDAGEEIEQDG